MEVPPGPRAAAGSSARAASARSPARGVSHGRSDGSLRSVYVAGPCSRSLPAHALGLVAVLKEPRQFQAAIPRQHDPVLWAEDVASPARIPLGVTEDGLVPSVDRVDLWIHAEVLGMHEFSDGDGHRVTSSHHVSCGDIPPSPARPIHHTATRPMSIRA